MELEIGIETVDVMLAVMVMVLVIMSVGQVRGMDVGLGVEVEFRPVDCWAWWR